MPRQREPFQLGKNLELRMQLTIVGRKCLLELDVHAIQVSIKERRGIPGAKQTIPVLV
jgi:hypothetical protein